MRKRETKKRRKQSPSGYGVNGYESLDPNGNFQKSPQFINQPHPPNQMQNTTIDVNSSPMQFSKDSQPNDYFDRTPSPSSAQITPYEEFSGPEKGRMHDTMMQDKHGNIKKRKKPQINTTLEVELEKELEAEIRDYNNGTFTPIDSPSSPMPDYIYTGSKRISVSGWEPALPIQAIKKQKKRKKKKVEEQMLVNSNVEDAKAEEFAPSQNAVHTEEVRQDPIVEEKPEEPTIKISAKVMRSSYDEWDPPLDHHVQILKKRSSLVDDKNSKNKQNTQQKTSRAVAQAPTFEPSNPTPIMSANPDAGNFPNIHSPTHMEAPPRKIIKIEQNFDDKKAPIDSDPYYGSQEVVVNDVQNLKNEEPEEKKELEKIIDVKKGIKRVLVEPKSLGIAIDLDHGYVEAVPAGAQQNLHDAGVEKGWRIVKVGKKRYSEKRIRQALAGKEPIYLEFLTVKPETENKRLVDIEEENNQNNHNDAHYALAEEMKDEQNPEIQELYLEFRQRNDGIGRYEFINACDRLKLGTLNHDEVFQMIDENEDGLIDYDEFIKASNGKLNNFFIVERNNHRMSVDTIFYLFDSNRAGSFNRVQFINGCNRIGIHPEDLTFDDIFDLIDKEEKKINYQEFKTAAKGNLGRFLFTSNEEELKPNEEYDEVEKRVREIYHPNPDGLLKLNQRSFAKSCENMQMNCGFGEIFDLIVANGKDSIDWISFKNAALGNFKLFLMNQHTTSVSELFEVFDVDGGGDVDRSEFIGGCHRAGFIDKEFGLEHVYALICNEMQIDSEEGLGFPDCLNAARDGRFTKFFMQPLGKRSRIQELFNVFDLDENEYIDRNEFTQGCERLGMDQNDLGFGEIFELIDLDGNQIIDFHEFQLAANGSFKEFFMKMKGKSSLPYVFKIFDMNNKNEITKDNFIEVCHNFGLSEKKLGFEDIFNLMDKNNRGGVNYEQFEDAIQGKLRKFFRLSKVKVDHVEVRQVSPQEANTNLLQLFQEFDYNHMNEIDRQKFMDGCDRLDVTANDLSYGEIFDYIDQDGGGFIEMEQFIEAADGNLRKFFERKKRRTTTTKLFWKFDLDRGGDIDKDEFIKGCQRLKMNENNFGLGDVFYLICPNNRDAIRFKDFKDAGEGTFQQFFQLLQNRKNGIYEPAMVEENVQEPIRSPGRFETVEHDHREPKLETITENEVMQVRIDTKAVRNENRASNSAHVSPEEVPVPLEFKDTTEEYPSSAVVKEKEDPPSIELHIRTPTSEKQTFSHTPIRDNKSSPTKNIPVVYEAGYNPSVYKIKTSQTPSESEWDPPLPTQFSKHKRNSSRRSQVQSEERKERETQRRNQKLEEENQKRIAMQSKKVESEEIHNGRMTGPQKYGQKGAREMSTRREPVEWDPPLDHHNRISQTKQTDDWSPPLDYGFVDRTNAPTKSPPKRKKSPKQKKIVVKNEPTNEELGLFNKKPVVMKDMKDAPEVPKDSRGRPLDWDPPLPIVIGHQRRKIVYKREPEHEIEIQRITVTEDVKRDEIIRSEPSDRETVTVVHEVRRSQPVVYEERREHEVRRSQPVVYEERREHEVRRSQPVVYEERREVMTHDLHKTEESQFSVESTTPQGYYDVVRKSSEEKKQIIKIDTEPVAVDKPEEHVVVDKPEEHVIVVTKSQERVDNRRWKPNNPYANQARIQGSIEKTEEVINLPWQNRIPSPKETNVQKRRRVQDERIADIVENYGQTTNTITTTHKRRKMYEVDLSSSIGVQETALLQSEDLSHSVNINPAQTKLSSVLMNSNDILPEQAVETEQRRTTQTAANKPSSKKRSRSRNEEDMKRFEVEQPRRQIVAGQVVDIPKETSINYEATYYTETRQQPGDGKVGVDSYRPADPKREVDEIPEEVISGDAVPQRDGDRRGYGQGRRNRHEERPMNYEAGGAQTFNPYSVQTVSHKTSSTNVRASPYASTYQPTPVKQTTYEPTRRPNPSPQKPTEEDMYTTRGYPIEKENAPYEEPPRRDPHGTSSRHENGVSPRHRSRTNPNTETRNPNAPRELAASRFSKKRYERAQTVGVPYGNNRQQDRVNLDPVILSLLPQHAQHENREELIRQRNAMASLYKPTFDGPAAVRRANEKVDNQIQNQLRVQQNVGYGHRPNRSRGEVSELSGPKQLSPQEVSMINRYRHAEQQSTDIFGGSERAHIPVRIYPAVLDMYVKSNDPPTHQYGHTRNKSSGNYYNLQTAEEEYNTPQQPTAGDNYYDAYNRQYGNQAFI